MKRLNFTHLLLSLTALLGMSLQAGAAQGWPSQYGGVMLQGFYWDSFKTDTKWTQLEEQADELSGFFDLVWIPNPGKAASQGNGYDPVYWFSNFNTPMGNESQLRSMIATFKSKGVGTIVDVVINHRSGASNWLDFPTEKWNGQTWKIPTSGITSGDEVWAESAYQDQTKYPRGNADTGEDFSGSRDLDHTNATVQDNCKNYCKFIMDDLGAVGFRLDMCKGYGGQYTKIYNQYSNPTFCVGEVFDGNYDIVSAWIEATGRTSAAFDFPAKFQMNKAFNNGQYNELVWKANGTTDQPAGMIHFGYPRYAVTFVDNHDTARDDWNKLSNNIEAANAFILCSPGTPCVFYSHWKTYKAAIKKMIAIRKAVGVHNESAVTVLQTDGSCYMAEVTGTKGKLVVKVGPSMVSPAGYSDSDIKASGTNYCIWTKVSVPDISGGGSQGGGDEGGDDPSGNIVYFDTTGSSWSAPINVWAWNDGGSDCVSGSWPGPAMTKVSDNIYSFSDFTGTPTGIIFSTNNGNDKAGGGDLEYHNGYVYMADGSSKPYTTGGGGSTTVGDIYLLGNVNGNAWSTSAGVAPSSKSGNTCTWSSVTIDDSGDGAGYFSFATTLGADWDAVNAGDRYGAASKDLPLALDGSATITAYPANVSALGCEAWKVAPGNYKIVADFSAMTVKLLAPGSDDPIVPTPTPGDIDGMYLMGNVDGCAWAPTKGVKANSKSGNAYTWNNVTFDDAGAGSAYFSFATALSDVEGDWDAVNASDRYGAPAADTPIALNQPSPIQLYAVNVSAMGCESWMVAAGNYKVVADFSAMTVTLSNPSLLQSIEADEAGAPAQWFTLQGMRVERPSAPGIYIRRQGGKTAKVRL